MVFFPVFVGAGRALPPVAEAASLIREKPS
jgi:hypothetical protein